MKIYNNIQDKIDDVLNSVDAVNDVKVSPFFKDKAMQRLFTEKDKSQAKVWSWFSPQLQLVTLMVFVVLNVFAMTQLDSNTSSEEIDEFAQTYSLTSTDYQSIFN
ncbi:hypothetical protein [Psychroserpens ponticola]|uniref:Uncharacterized protein n=1 Tax=Psychroserpens ponticola TaxID=2932268 RepID=A0ABY7RU76_9FLAO|nr:hypothetical protein [Psychroserpens ponticola]WCO00654.1 hypothetical protein MUN68_011310 [Psychroserpens ponticola]